MVPSTPTYIYTEGISKILTNIFETITADDALKTNVLGFMDNSFSYDIQ
jgi:hypothetical protein